MSVDVSHYRRFAEQMAGKPGAINNSAAACFMLQLCSLFEERWISVSERLPESGQAVLVWFHGEVQMAWFNHFTNGVAYFVRDTHYNFEPTHWMPLPEPPEVT